MITKLKYLRTYYKRDILPAVGATIGKILYTKKNPTGRRKQFVIDLDAKSITEQTINAAPANPLTSPGAVVLSTSSNTPSNDRKLYLLTENKLPAIIALADGTVHVTLAQGVTGVTGVIANVMANDTIDGVAVTTSNCNLTLVTGSSTLTLNANGSIDLHASSAPGTYTVTYKVTDKNEPTNYKTAVATVIVDAA